MLEKRSKGMLQKNRNLLKQPLKKSFDIGYLIEDMKSKMNLSESCFKDKEELAQHLIGSTFDWMKDGSNVSS